MIARFVYVIKSFLEARSTCHAYPYLSHTTVLHCNQIRNMIAILFHSWYCCDHVDLKIVQSQNKVTLLFSTCWTAFYLLYINLYRNPLSQFSYLSQVVMCCIICILCFINTCTLSCTSWSTSGSPAAHHLELGSANLEFNQYTDGIQFLLCIIQYQWTSLQFILCSFTLTLG